MTLDWTNVAIVFFLFAGVTMAVLSMVFAAADFRPPISPKERQRNDLMAMIEEMHRTAALAEAALRRLAVMQKAVGLMLSNQDARWPRHHVAINESEAGFSERMSVLPGSWKRR